MKDLLNWIANGNVGTSSKTMWCVAVGVECTRPGRPYDPDDLWRCMRLVEACPGIRDAFPAIAAKYPWWKPYLDNWDRLVAMLMREMDGKKAWIAPDTYAAMMSLEPEVRRLQKES
jgi:hypothetical protein